MDHSEHWLVRGRRTVFVGGPVREVAIENVVLPDGSETEYYQVVLGDFALVYATTEERAVIVLRQYKHGPRRICLTFPGGAVNGDESPLAAAQRELLEETGFTSNRWMALGSFVTNANQGCNTAHLFRADGCRRVSAPTSPDIEGGEMLLMAETGLLQPDRLVQFGLASHAALLAIATHPALGAAARLY